MSLCSSTLWGDIVKVTAYPYNSLSFNHPMNVEKIILSMAKDNTDSGKDISIMSSTTPFVLTISDMDATLKDDFKVSVAGTSHTVKLEYNMLCDSNNLTDYQTEITKLEDITQGYHLLIEYLGGNKHFVRSNRDGYSFDWKVADSGKTSCTITIHNVSGPQKVQPQANS